MFDFLKSLWNTILYGREVRSIAFCHPDDFDFVNSIRMKLLAEGEKLPFSICTDDGNLTGYDADGTATEHGSPEPGRVFFLVIRTRAQEVRTLTFEG